MRKKIWSIAITLPLVLAFGIGSMAFTRHLSTAYKETVERAEDSVRAGEYEAAGSVLAKLAEEWEASEKVLRLWVPHTDTDGVTIHLKEARAGIALRDETMCAEHLTALLEALDHLHHRDDLTIENIL